MNSASMAALRDEIVFSGNGMASFTSRRFQVDLRVRMLCPVNGARCSQRRRELDAS